MVLALLAILQASDWLYASAVEDTVTMEVKDSDDGSEAFSENAESVSPLSLAMSLHEPCLVRNCPCMKSWWWSEGRLCRKARLCVISEASASNSAWARSFPLSRCSSLVSPAGGWSWGRRYRSVWALLNCDSNAHSSPKIASRFTSWFSVWREKKSQLVSIYETKYNSGALIKGYITAG